MMIPLFSAGLFLSSALIFLIEPMMAKSVLPYLGGGPQIWNTCVLFYQLALLGGYGYAHLLSERLPPARQAIVHVLLCAAATASLFMAPTSAPTQPPAWPILWLMGHLTWTIGLPFFVLSANGPLLQRWFSHVSKGTDPYLLFTVSNLGSFLALGAFPFLIEPRMTRSLQMEYWRIGFLLFFASLAACAAVFYRLKNPKISSSRIDEPLPRARWIFLSFVPSSLMLGVTTYLTTDLSPVPLLWVAPLALYLASLIIVFLPSGPLWLKYCKTILPFVSLGLLSLVNVGPMWTLLALHLGVFFIAAIVCHGELAGLRPSPQRLTDFYLCMVFGGALGGLFNALGAPLLFNRVHEYPLALLLACATAVWLPSNPEKQDWKKAASGAAAILAGAGFLLYRSTHPGILIGPALAVVIPLVLIGAWAGLHRQRLLLGLVFAAVLILKSAWTGKEEQVLYSGRSFFGIHRITADLKGEAIFFYHGRVSHGLQYREPWLRRRPAWYYDPAGPMGGIFELIRRMPLSPAVAVVGLGPGAISAYARPKEKWDLYEIDPAVARIAQDKNLFTYLHDSPAEKRIILGDARMTMAAAPDHGYKAIIIDAFGSDAVPVHLLTREAVALYLSKLTPDGLLIFHVSNAYLDLLQPVGDLGRSHGLAVIAAQDPGGSSDGIPRPRSRWVLMSRNAKALAELAPPSMDKTPKGRVWTDDYSDLFSAVRWR